MTLPIADELTGRDAGQLRDLRSDQADALARELDKHTQPAAQHADVREARAKFALARRGLTLLAPRTRDLICYAGPAEPYIVSDGVTGHGFASLTALESFARTATAANRKSTGKKG